MAAFSANSAMGVTFIIMLFLCLGRLELAVTTELDVNGTTLPEISATESGNVTGPEAAGFDYRSAHLNCRCGPLNSTKRIKIDPEVAEMYYKAKMNATLGSEMKNFHFLTEKDCTKCTVHYMTCHGEDETYFLNCIRRTVKFSRVPKTSLMKKTGKVKSKTIVKRSARASEYVSFKDGDENDFNFESVPVENGISPDTASSAVTAGRGKFPNRRVIKRIRNKHFHVPVGGKTSNGTRVRRAAVGACMIPLLHNDFNAEFLCTYSEDLNGTSCLQHCAWGHTLPSRRITELYRCYDYSTNVWEPHHIKPCEAFVNCDIDLVSPGRLECSPITITEGPTCKISCRNYEDQDAVPEYEYTCNIDGKWNRELPFCVSRSAALVLAHPPNKKIHNDLDDYTDNFKLKPSDSDPSDSDPSEMDEATIDF